MVAMLVGKGGGIFFDEVFPFAGRFPYKIHLYGEGESNTYPVGRVFYRLDDTMIYEERETEIAE